MDHGGLRMKLFKAQADASDIVLLFVDVSDFAVVAVVGLLWQIRCGP